MQLFVIPSWYPTKDYPVSGIMIKEQTEAFCKAYPEFKVGISVWGNTELQYLLLAKDHIKNLKKLFLANTRPYTKKLLPNLTAYHKPAFSWTRKIRNGNINAIVEANLYNLKAFEADAGPVDLIHAHVGSPAGIIAMEISRKLKIPYCLTERMGPFPSVHTRDRNNRLLGYYKQPYKESAINIAVSPFQVQAMRSQGIENIAMIPNFLDENKFRPAVQQKPQSQNFTFFSLSFISPQKGTDQLVYAIKEITETQQHIRFRIGGDGPSLNTYKVLAEQLRVDQYIEWLGEIDHEVALQEYQNCDAFVLPSLYESMGIVYIEALACGKPIIATKCGGPESTVKPLNGLLVEKDNTGQLAAAMIYMIENRDNYNSEDIRQDFLARYSSKAVVPQLLAVYEEVVKQHTRNT